MHDFEALLFSDVSRFSIAFSLRRSTTAAIGLAITFGVMGVINMAHGEMVMLGAYTTFIVQQTMRAYAPDSALLDYSLVIAVPLAFLITGFVGILIERGIIRFLYGRPLDTLLATWGLSLVLQQAVRTAFGPTNKDVSSPSWMSGSFDLGHITITYSRLWIVLFTLLVFVLLLMGPVFSSGAITIEREQRTLAGLLTSLLTAPQIWWGKFVAALLYLLLLLTSAIPLLALSFAFGGVGPLDLVKAIGSTILTLASICTIGLWCSATFRRSVHATASCYAIVLVLTIVTAISFGMLYAHWQQSHPEDMGPPAYIQAPLFLNPLYPLLTLTDDNGFRFYVYSTSSWLLFAALGCLAAAFAMRRLRRSGEQL